MKVFLAIALLLLVQPGLALSRDKQADRIATLIAATDGATKETAFKVRSVDEEYQILRALHCKPGLQSLIIGDDNHPYDMLDVTAPDGTRRQLWFDIKSFFGHEFGL
ncbi:hypothetical protein BH10PSE14_BH10PSE14_15900 [soil metagenome]